MSIARSQHNDLDARHSKLLEKTAEQARKIADYETKIRANIELKSQKETQKIELLKQQEEKKVDKQNLVRINEEIAGENEKLSKMLKELELKKADDEGKLNKKKQELMMCDKENKELEKQNYKARQETKRNA